MEVSYKLGTHLSEIIAELLDTHSELIEELQFQKLGVIITKAIVDEIEEETRD